MLDFNEGNPVPVVERVLTSYPSLRPCRSQILIALEEGRGNVARHAMDPTGGRAFVHHRTLERTALEFLLADLGKGYRIDGKYPPYPEKMIGQEYEYRQTLEGALHCHITGEDVVEIAFEASATDCKAEYMNLPVGGMGLSIISKVMDRVTYLSRVGSANFLWMQLHIPDETRP